MLRINPPQRAPDDPAMLILASDPAWDFARIIAERRKLGETSDHPFLSWLRGESGYSLAAPVTVPEAVRGEGPAATTIKHWLRPDARPTYFEIRRLTALEWEAASYRPESANVEITRRALVRVHNAEGPDGSPIVIDPPRDASGLISMDWIDALSAANRDALGEIANAAAKVARGGDGLGKP